METLDIYSTAKEHDMHIGKLDSMDDRIMLACTQGIGVHFSLNAALCIHNTHYIKHGDKVVHIGNFDSVHNFLKDYTSGK